MTHVLSADQNLRHFLSADIIMTHVLSGESCICLGAPSLLSPLSVAEENRCNQLWPKWLEKSIVGTLITGIL